MIGIESERAIQKQYLQELIRLIDENPDLPVIPMVSSEICEDCCYCCYRGAWGRSEVRKFYNGEDVMHFYEPDDWESVDVALDDAFESDVSLSDDALDDEMKKAYESLPWTEAIIVYIRER